MSDGIKEIKEFEEEILKWGFTEINNLYIKKEIKDENSRVYKRQKNNKRKCRKNIQKQRK